MNIGLNRSGYTNLPKVNTILFCGTKDVKEVRYLIKTDLFKSTCAISLDAN
jgi:hypothetical protein